MKESPLFIKTYDLIKWLLEHTAKFPRNQRAVLARRIEESSLGFYDHLLAAAVLDNVAKKESLASANVELERLKVYLRLAFDLALVSLRQYEFVSQRVTEVGKLFGGWLKKM